jgi:predicted RNase H-like HicB family nuclease
MGYATVKGRKFTVMMKRERVGGYSVWVLELPGCISQGESKEEALANIREAIEGYLEARQIMMKKEAKGAEPIEITL